jgi:predicted GNAT family acetyltransferase
MELRCYENVSDFLADTQDLLEQNEASNSLFLANCFRLKNESLDTQSTVYLRSIYNQQELLLVAMKMPGYAINLCASNGISREAIELLTADLLRKGVAVEKVLSPAATADQFAQVWCRAIHCEIVDTMSMGIYRLEIVKPVGSSGHLRLANENDLETISEWVYEMNVEINEPVTRGQAHLTADGLVKKQQVYVWDDNGIVSMASKARPTVTGISISRVYTPERHRNKGYASSCVAALSQLLLDAGYTFCTLFTDLANSTSNGIYMKIGYEPVCEFKKISFRPGPM